MCVNNDDVMTIGALG